MDMLSQRWIMSKILKTTRTLLVSRRMKKPRGKSLMRISRRIKQSSKRDSTLALTLSMLH